MDQEIIDKDLGDKGKLELDLVKGDLKLSVTYAISGVPGSVAVSVQSDVLIDKLAALIPGKVDDAIFNVLKAALKS